jgi:cell wall-associated NlpC family hydrolase
MITDQNKKELVAELRKMIGFPYKTEGYDPSEGGFHCWGFFVWSYKCAAEMFEMPELLLPNDIWTAEKNFRLLAITETPRFLDIVVMKDHDLSDRHAGLMLDDRWFIHCSSSTNGVACSELTRNPYRTSRKHYGRHKVLN